MASASSLAPAFPCPSCSQPRRLISPPANQEVVLAKPGAGTAACVAQAVTSPRSTPSLTPAPSAFLSSLPQHEQDILRSARVVTQLDLRGLSPAALCRLFGEPSAELLAAQSQARRMLRFHIEEEVLPPPSVFFGVRAAPLAPPCAALAFALHLGRRCALRLGEMSNAL